MKLPKVFTDKLSQDKIDKVVQVAKNLGIKPIWLLAVMFFESGKTFSPAKTNQIGSVGLIQFTRDKKGVEYKTIGGKKYMLSDLAKMSFIQQMDVVQAYYKEAMGKNKITSFVDTYLVTFFPAALGQPDDFIFQTKNLSAALIAQQNPAFDNEGGKKDGLIYKREVVASFKKWYTAAGFDFDNEINIGGAVSKVGIVALLVVFFYTYSTIMYI